MLYRVTVDFDRLNSCSVLERSERSATIHAVTKAEAKQKYLKQFRRNEPNRKKIHSVKVELVDARLS